MPQRWTTFFAAAVLVANLACGAVPGVEDDQVSSFEESLKQAEQGEDDWSVLFGVGLGYAMGVGVMSYDGFEPVYRVPRNYVQAHKWFNLAASRATDPTFATLSADTRDLVANNLSPDQLAEAERLAREWDEAHPR